jgi:uncharacterized protein (TIGR00255 family)
MTGYGEAQAKSRAFQVSVTAKSVNNRNFKLNLTAPEELDFLSAEIEMLAKKFLSRGTLYIQIECESLTAPLFAIDGKVLSSYYSQLARLRKRLGLSPEVSVELLALLPGSVRSQERGVRGEVVEPGSAKRPRQDSPVRVILSASEQALKKLKRAREEEGAKIEKDISRRAKSIREALAQIEKRQGNFLKDYSHRLAQRVREILEGMVAKVSDRDLVREAALVAQRQDVSEEIERLLIHLTQLYGALKSDQPVGRRLEFITQEMLREANTISNKSADPRLVVPILNMKAQVDRIREQAQNVE